MDVDESDNEISDNGESDSDNEGEQSSSEDSEEESDDDDENEDGTKSLSDEEDEREDVSDDDDDNDTDAANTVTGDDDDGTIASDDEEALDKEDLPDSSVDDPDESCPICLNGFVGQDLGSPENCNHTFCLDCIVEWSKNVNTCPIDRIEFHLIYVKQEISGDVIKKIKVKVRKEVEEYVEEVTLCQVCRLGDREDRLLLCDSCDSGYHCECLDPPLETIPIEEWFCPPCAGAINRRAAGSHSSHSRLIARTSASEIVRSRIQNHRAANSEDSDAEAVQQQRNVPAARRSPKRRRITKRKTKRKTTRKSPKSKSTKARTKATAASGKAKAKKSTAKTSTKRRRKTKRRKTRKTKKKSRRSWLASMKLVAPSVKKRIADRLGLCKPPPGHTMPYVKKSGGQHSVFVEQLPSLDMFGGRDQLLDFEESYAEDNLGNSRPSTSKHISKLSYSRKPIAVASASGINLLDNILENQNVLLQSSKNITIGKDGSLNRKENLSAEAKYDTKSSKSETKNESSMHVKEEKNVVPWTSSLGTEVKSTSAAAAGSSVNVKREKHSPSPDPPSVCAKSMKLDDTLSFSPFPVKKGNKHLQSRVRFSDVETNFTVKDSVNSNMLVQSAENVLLSASVGYLPCTSSFRSEKKDIPSSEPSVYIKKENCKDFPLDSLVDMIGAQAEKVYENGNNKPSVSCNQSLLLKDGPVSSSSVSNAAEKRAFYNSDINSSKLSFPCGPNNSISVKGKLSSEGHSQRSSEPACTKTEECSVSLFDKAQNDRKRHLPFLSNGVSRPFKIPKRNKCMDGSPVSKANVFSSEISGKHLDTKVLIKSENLLENKLSSKHMLLNEGFQSDLKSQNMHEEHTLTKCTSSLSEAVDIDMHADLDENMQSIKGNNSLLHVFKQEKMNESWEKPDKHSKRSLLSVPNSWNDHAAHNKDNSECTVNGFLVSQKLSSEISSVSLNSNHRYSDKKSHGCLSSLSSKTIGVENGKQKHLFDLDCVEQGQNRIAAKKHNVLKVKEDKAPNKTDKVVSKHSKHELQERIAAEVKKHLKDFYLTDLITKEEYKEIMRRSVPKVLQNCGNSIDSEKIRKLVVSYVHSIGNTRSECS